MLCAVEKPYQGADVASIFGRELRKAREAIGMSGYALAKKSGLSQQNLHSVEKGTRPPSDDNMKLIAGVKELGVSYETLRAWADMDKISPQGFENILRTYLDKPEDVELIDHVATRLKGLWERTGLKRPGPPQPKQ